MACSNPLPAFNLTREQQFHDLPMYYFAQIPCNRCLNCRIDRINAYSDRCEYELIQRRAGAFVTFTYDDYHIQPLLRKDSKGNTVATLSRDESRRFLYRLNKNVKKELKSMGMDTCPLMQKDYKYVLSGEYGDHGKVFNRPHFHALFFGLDWAFCKKIFARSWQGRGEIKVLPIMNGAPQYVLDYITTLEYGEMRKIKYEYNNLEPPFQVHSTGLGAGLYHSQLEYIKKHENCYRWHGKDRPIPTYWRNKFLLPRRNFFHKVSKMAHIAYSEGRIPLQHNLFNLKYLTDLHNFSLQKAEIRESNLRKKSKRAIMNVELINEQLFDFKYEHDEYYRIKYPSLIDLGYSSEEIENYYKNQSYYDIQDIVDKAIEYYLDPIPF